MANTNNLTGFSEADGSSAGVSLAGGALSKTIYALNGAVCSSQACAGRSSRSGRYAHLPHQLPTLIGDFEKFRHDRLPAAARVQGGGSERNRRNQPHLDLRQPGNPTPASGKWLRGPADTQLARSAIVPSVTTNAVSNSLKWNYGTYDDRPTHQPPIDILFTMTVSADPFTDGLFLTNQVRQEDQNTAMAATSLDAIVQFQLTEPVLNIKKGGGGDRQPGRPSSPRRPWGQ